MATLLLGLLAGCGEGALPLGGRMFLLSSSQGFEVVGGTTGVGSMAKSE